MTFSNLKCIITVQSLCFPMIQLLHSIITVVPAAPISNHDHQGFFSPTSFPAGLLTPLAAPVPTVPAFSAVLPGATFGSVFFAGAATFPSLFISLAFAPAAIAVGAALAAVSTSLGNPSCALNSPFFSLALMLKVLTSSACRTWITSLAPMVLMSFSCLGKCRMGRSRERSWRGVRGAWRERVW